MNDILSLIDRAAHGEPLAKETWDFERVLMTTRRMVDKYQLSWNPSQVIPCDPSLAERVFEAGLELAQILGIYFITSGTVLRFDPAELETALRQAPQTLTLGEGDDARTLYARRVQDEFPPLIWAGNPGAPTPEELFLPCVKSWMQEPIVDLATCGSLTHVDGRIVRGGEPLEIAAVRRELRFLRQGLQEVGRPGMGLLAAQSAVTAIGDQAAAHPDYLRPCDAHIVALFNELIIDQDNLARVVNAQEYGMKNASLATVMVGGLAGDAPGAAVVQTASIILANLVCAAHYHLLHPIHIRHVATSTRSVMWVQSIVSQAFARCAPCILVADIYPKSGALTREVLYETAANAIAITVSGAHLEGVGSADGALPNGSGLEARWMGEVGHAITRQGMTLPEANRIVLRLLECYEHVFKLPGGNPGVRFDTAYNLETLQPVPQWLDLYHEVKDHIRRIGLNV